MADMMTFPDTVEEFMEEYKLVDTEQVYTNGTELIPIFRMKQWFEHEKAQLSKEGATSDLISRQAVIDALNKQIQQCRKALGSLSLSDVDKHAVEVKMASLRAYRKMLENLPTIQPEVLACGNGELVATPEPQWIPVSERLPEESEYYIITANDGVGHRTTFAKFQKKAKSWNLTGARSYWRVIAWMPLPEPYKPNK